MPRGLHPCYKRANININSLYRIVFVLQETAEKSERRQRKHKDRSRTQVDNEEHSRRRASKRDADQHRPVTNDLEEFLGCGDGVSRSLSTGPYESL